MVEKIIVAGIIIAAAFWFYRWLRGAASGEKGCSCGGCSRDCASRGAAEDVAGAGNRAAD